jgi:hypothetical protein
VSSLAYKGTRLFAELAFFGAVMFIAGVLIQALMPYGTITGLGVALQPSGAFILIHGTILYYMGKGGHEMFPDKYTGFSVAVMCTGLAVSAIPVFYPSTSLMLEIPGPLVFAYGFVLFMLQVRTKYGIGNWQLAILSIILLATGILVPFFLNLFQNSAFLPLAILPAVSGVFLLYVPMSGKTFRFWQKSGYFQ